MKKSYDQIREHVKKQSHYSVDKGCLIKAMIFPVVLYGCESWNIRKAEHQRIDAFELWCKIKPINPKWNYPWIFIGRADAEGPIFWAPESKYWFIEKYPDAGTDWRQEVKGMMDDRRWDVWMASLIQWIWVWTISVCWWWTGKFGMLQFVGMQRTSELILAS